MFGFGKKVEIKKIDINEGFRQYEKILIKSQLYV